ncbi:hypothetical protein GCM10027180_05350 [Microbulbifer echini]
MNKLGRDETSRATTGNENAPKILIVTMYSPAEKEGINLIIIVLSISFVAKLVRFTAPNPRLSFKFFILINLQVFTGGQK